MNLIKINCENYRKPCLQIYILIHNLYQIHIFEFCIVYKFQINVKIHYNGHALKEIVRHWVKNCGRKVEIRLKTKIKTSYLYV